MNIETLISQAAGEAVKALYGMEASEKMLQLQKTRSEFEGNLTLVVFPFVKAANERMQSQARLDSAEREQARLEAKAAKKSPEQTAQEIGQYLVDHCDLLVAAYDGKPGGTAQTVAYANEQSRSVRIISPTETEG